MNSTNLVTCVIPVYNGQAYLMDALVSVVAQSYGGIDIIVVDDGSTDATPQILSEFG